MKLLLSLLCLTFIQENFAQYSDFFTFNAKSYKIESVKEANGNFKFTFTNDANATQEFSLNPLKMDAFITTSLDKFAILLGVALTAPETITLKNQFKEQFFKLMAANLVDQDDLGPISGRLKIMDKATAYPWNEPGDKKDALLANPQIVIKDVQVEFGNGFIETVKIIGIVNGTEYVFENKYGIGFSTRRNFEALNSTRLFSTTAFSKGKYYFVILGDIFKYNYTVYSQTRDFSPGDQVLSSYGGQTMELRRDASSKLLEARVFSDFLGFDNDKANGLIQTELFKKINLNNYRYQSALAIKPFWQGFGWLQFIKTNFVISKIEENNKFLLPEKEHSIVKGMSGSDSLTSTIYSDPLKIIYHQTISLGLDLNLWFAENSDLKFHLYLNGGFRYGRTLVRDSLTSLNDQNEIEKTGFVNDFGINYFVYYPEIVLNFLPEERFNIIITERPQFFRSAFRELEILTLDKATSGFSSNPKKWINSFEIMGTIKTGAQGKLFARWRYNSQIGNNTQNFSQLQVGYSFYVLRQNPK